MYTGIIIKRKTYYSDPAAVSSLLDPITNDKTLEDIHEESKVSITSIYRAKNGNKPLRGEVLILLARFLKCDANLLIAKVADKSSKKVNSKPQVESHPATNHSKFITSDDSGILGYWPSLPLGTGSDLSAEIHKATDCVSILQTWLSNPSQLRDDLGVAIKGGVKNVQILLLNPDSIMFKYRAQEFRDKLTLAEARTRYETSIGELKELIKQNKNIIKIKLYDGTPTLCLHRVDNKVYVGYYWRRKSAVSGPQIVASVDKGYGKEALAHFNAIWDSIPDKKPAKLKS